MISVQEEDFDPGAEYQQLVAGDTSHGAAVLFVGRVRDWHPAVDSSEAEPIVGLTLEHYPGMTQKALEDIAEQARQRWQLGCVRIIHRVGRLAPGDAIVLVGVTSAHRAEAFAAAEFLMDYLKTRAPFWKKEERQSGEQWVAAKASDQQAAERW